MSTASPADSKAIGSGKSPPSSGVRCSMSCLSRSCNPLAVADLGRRLVFRLTEQMHIVEANVLLGVVMPNARRMAVVVEKVDGGGARASRVSFHLLLLPVLSAHARTWRVNSVSCGAPSLSRPAVKLMGWPRLPYREDLVTIVATKPATPFATQMSRHVVA